MHEDECFHPGCFGQNHISNLLLLGNQQPKAVTVFDGAFRFQELFPIDSNYPVFSEAYNEVQLFYCLALLLHERRICFALGFFLNNAKVYLPFLEVRF